MASATFIDLNVNMAEQFKESVSEATANSIVYLTFGKAGAWANDAAPPDSNSSIASVFEIWDEMIGAKRLFGSDFSHAIPRNNWTANTDYTAYDHMSTTLFDTANTKMVVVSSTYNVYKCISNNYSSLSTAEPTSTNPSIISTTADGYMWKYMYTISDADQLKFMTDDYIPVKTLTIDDGSQQWNVQNTAIDGAIHYIEVTDEGSGYSNANAITITITGDGYNADAYATINTASNTVNAIIMSDEGNGYTYANVYITSTEGSGVLARAIISPPGGHGSSPIYELGGRYIMVNGRLKYDEIGVLPVDNDFRQIALLKDPKVHGSTEICSNSAVLQATTITTIGSGNYIQDEWLYQGASLLHFDFKGQVVSWDSTTNKVILTNTFGAPTASKALTGQDSAVSRIVASVTEEGFQNYSGKLLYCNNLQPITRSSDQIEDFKICISM